MSAPKKKRLAKRKGKIRISTSAQLIHKNDKTRVARRNTLDSIPRMPAQMPRTVAPVFKVKIRKKQ